MRGVSVLSRRIGNASAAVLFVFLLLSAIDLHAGWDLTYPFFHEESPAAATLQSATMPAAGVPAPAKPGPMVKPPAVPAAAVPQLRTSPQPEPAKRSGEQHHITMSSPEPVSQADKAVTSPSSPQPVNDPLLTITYNSRTLAPFAATATYGGEVFSQDTHWQGLIRLDGWVTVAPQATLTIHPQTVVRIATNGGIHVLGRIVVKGSPESPVLLSSLYVEPAQGDWRGIVLSGTEKKNSFEHVRIEGADTALSARLSALSARSFTISRAAAAFQLQDAVATLAEGRISACSNGVAAVNGEIALDSVVLVGNRTGMTLNSSSVYGTDVSMANNRFSGLVASQSHLRLDRFSIAQSETGAKLVSCEGSIINSVFRDNGEAGMALSGSRLKLTGNLLTGNRIGLQADDNLPVLWGNSLHDNRSYNLLYLGSENFFAGGNWFGPAGAGALEKTVFSKRPGAVITEPLLEADPLPGD